MKISKETYELFLKHGSELLWLSDPTREPRPRGTNNKTDQEFGILEKLDESMELFHNDYYSKKWKNSYASTIENLRSRVTDEVFELIEKSTKNNSESAWTTRKIE